MKNYGPPGASSNGFNENLALFNSGKCGMWVDATVAASFVSDPKQSKVADQVGFAPAPCEVTCKGANWLWAWSLAIPAGSQKVEAAEKFIAWATGKEYLAARGRQGRLGERPAGHPQIALCQCGLPEGSALRRDDPEGDRHRRSESPAR